MKIRPVLLAMAMFTACLQSPNADADQQHDLTSAPLLALWVGDWQGSGWSVTPSGERIEFSLAETVSEKAGGTVLVLEGHGIRTEGAAAGTTTHDGFVLIYRDALGRLRWNGHEASAASVDTELSITEDGLRWSLPADHGAIVRFTIRLDAANWIEFGEVSVDGSTWHRFMEVTLTKAS